MIELNHYLQDGANHQARAVLCFLQGFNIEESWDKEYEVYKAEPKVSRWQNGREQGYIITMRTENYSRQINIAFFEHRNSDSICAVKWLQSTMDAPTIQSAEFGEIYKDKYDVSFSVDYGKIEEMAKWIQDELSGFWLAEYC